MSSSKILGSTFDYCWYHDWPSYVGIADCFRRVRFQHFFNYYHWYVGVNCLYRIAHVSELHQHADYDATLHTLAKQFLGDEGKWIATFAMLFLFYALCAAYIAGGGGQFNDKLHNWFAIDVSNGIGTLIFTIIIAAIVTFGTHSVDRVNRVLFTCKLIAMAVMLFF